MIARHALAVALLTALAGASAPRDVEADTLAGFNPKAADTAILKAVEKQPYYVRHRRGRGNPAEIALTMQGAEITHRFPEIDTVAVMLPVAAIEALQNAINSASHADIDFMEPVPEHKPAAQVVPWNVDQFQSRDIWDVNRDGQIDGGAPDGSGLKVCIIDTGFFAAHDDFQGITASGVSQITGENWFEDGNGHGSHVAGTFNAVNNDIGVVGVLPGGAEFFIVKIFNNAGVWVAGQSNLGAAATACRNAGASVVSMSLGGGASATEEAIFQANYDSFGIINVAAAGNDGNNVASYPASYESVISVAAIDQSAVAAEFTQTPNSIYPTPTNTTPQPNTEWDVVEFAGGGVNVLSTVPAPNGSVPTYSATVSSIAYGGTHVAESGLGTVTGTLVNGGLCTTGSGNASWNSAIVLCERGSVAFSEKINEVRARGGRAAIIFNNVPGGLAATCGGGCTQPSIPAIGLSQADGLFLRGNRIGLSTTVVADDGTSCTNCTGGYDFYSGTSMATPGVAAAASFVWNACGGPARITNKELRKLLRDSALDLTGTQAADPAVAGDTPIIYGAGWDRVTGWGLVQLRSAYDLGVSRFGAECSFGFNVAPTVLEVCGATTPSASFNVTIRPEFTGSATLSASGAPGGPNAFSVNPVVNPTKTSIYTVNGIGALATGNYPITFTGTHTTTPANTATEVATLRVASNAPGTLALTAPANAATNVATSPTLSWSAAANAFKYTVQVATDAAFTAVVYSATVAGTTHTVGTTLAPATQYFWRVTPTNTCGNGTASATFSFTTDTMVCLAPNLAIPDNVASGANSNITLSSARQITDMDVSVAINHTFVGDLTVTLRHVETGTVVTLLNRPDRTANGNCQRDNINAILSDEAATAVEGVCANATPTINGTFRPVGLLTGFDTQSYGGTWTLNVSDNAAADTGTLADWCLIPTLAAAANSPPSFTSTAVTAATEDAAYTYNITTADVDAGATLTLTAPVKPAWLTFTPGANGAGTLTGTPTNAQVGTHNVTLRVTDGIAAPVDQVFVITVSNTNDAPTFTSTAVTTATENAAYNYAITTADVDAGATLTITAQTSPAWLTFTPGANGSGTLSGTPTNAQVGPHNVTLRVTDGIAAPVDQAFTVTVANVNDAPTFTSVPVTAATQGTAYNYAVTTADVDAGASLTVTAPTLPGWLTFAPGPNGTASLSGTPGNAQVGNHSVTLRVTDGIAAPVDQSFTITVANVNDAPVAVGTISSRSDAEGATVTQATAANFADADSDTLTYSASGLPTGLSINATSGVISGTLAFTANGSSPFSVVVTATDPSTATATQAFTWTVTNINRAPNAVGSITNRSDAEGAIVTQATAANFADADSDTLSYSASGLPTGLSINATTGVISGTLAFTANASSPFSVVVTATDPSSTTASQAFTWTVSNINRAPNALGSIASRSDAEGATVTQSTAANFADADSDTLTYSASSLPIGLSINPTTGVISGTLAFTANASSPFNVTVTATDPSTATASQAFTWTVTNNNRAPAAAGTIADRTDVEGASVTQATAANFSDADSDVLVYSAAGLPVGLSIDAFSGVISGTLSFAANGGSPYSVVVTATDTSNATATQAFTWTVTNINRGPAASGTIANRSDAEGAVVSQATAARFTDADGDTLSYSATGLPTGLSINVTTGEISGTLSLAANGGSPYGVVVTATDPSNAMATQSFTWTVTNTNQAPAAVGTIGNQSNAEGATITPLATAASFADADSDTLSYSATGLPASLTINASSGAISGTLTFNSAGVHNVVVTATDPSNAIATQAFTWTVTGTNQAPTVILPIADQSNAEGAGVNVDTAANFADADAGQSLSYSADVLPAGLSITAAGLISGTVAFTAATGSPYSVTITANDGDGGTVTDTFLWTVTETNRGPIFTSTAATTATEDSVYTYNITTADPDAGATLTLTALTRPAWLTFTPGTNGTGTITGTPSNAAVGAHNITLRVSDGISAPVDQTFQITVSNTNDAPAFTNEPYTFSVIEGSSTDTVVGTVLATDADAGSSLVYAITGGNTGNAFKIDAISGAISVATPGAVTLANSAFSLAVSVSDGNGGLDSSAATITVLAGAPVDPAIFSHGFEGN